MNRHTKQRQGAEALVAAARSLGDPDDLHKKIVRRMALVDTGSLLETLSICALGPLNDDWYVDIEYLISNALSIPPAEGRRPPGEQDLVALFRLARRVHLIEMWTAMGSTTDGLAASVASHAIAVRVKAGVEQMLQESLDRFDAHDDWMRANLGFGGRSPALFGREVLSGLHSRTEEAFRADSAAERGFWEAHTHSRKIGNAAVRLPDLRLRRQGVRWLRLGRGELQAAAVRAGCETELDGLLSRLSQELGSAPSKPSFAARSSLYDRPFVALPDGQFLLPLPTTLPECVADTFVADMLRDSTYRATLLGAKGRIAEERCLRVLERAAHKDFLFANPGRSEGKEFADAVLWLGDTLVIIQSKSRHLLTRNGERDADGLKAYVRKTVGEALRQARGARRRLYQGGSVTLENSRRGSVNLDRSLVKRVFLVVVLDERLPFSTLDELGVEVGPRSDDFPHVFYLNDLELILGELDTPTDFFDYLEAREELQRRGKYDVNDEMDILGYYLLRGRTFPLLEKESEAGWVQLYAFWESYTEPGGPRDQRRQANRMSYYVDGIVDFAHTAGGQYARPAELLASLTRVERRMVGKLAYQKAVAAIGSDRPRYGAMLVDRPGFGLVLMYSSQDRRERAIMLQDLTILAQHLLGLPTMLGVASEPADHRRTSFDFVRSDCPGFMPDPDTQARAQQIFGPPVAITERDYPAQGPPDDERGNDGWSSPGT